MDNEPVNSEYIDDFFEETVELIDILETDILKLETAPADQSTINSVFRCFHSIKGGASLLGLN